MSIWPEADAQFTEYWLAGLSTGEIGRRLGVSGSAIAGRRRRLGLPERPSPIKRNPDAPPRHIPRAPKLTLPALSSPPPSLPPPPPAPPKPAAVVWMRPRHPCQWPIGTPGSSSFRFCEDLTEPGKPYCEDHCKLAYVRVRDRREDAA